MRLLIDLLVALMLAGVLAGVMYFNRQRDEHESHIRRTQQAITQIQGQLKVQMALERVEVTDTGWPRTVDPDWFPLDPPRNMLLQDGRAWLEVAGPEDRLLRHPRSITADGRSLASFWYNPYSGVVRARVPAGTTDVETLALYNRVNRTELLTIVSEWAR